ncbi:MAG: bifunctional folylpolyglutamate synthase/dihydrofolate synthase [Prevotella sp.]|nr:bifunctional folylpolyglutamate synthase/dihydrofolate synthase [Prevotella sp.]
MTYSEVTDYLFGQTANYERQGASGYKKGLDNMIALNEHLGRPHRRFRSIHVAGTNGKGSVSHTLAAQLQVCGYKVGLYTSPHLLDFRERIRVNGQCIPEDYVTHFVEENNNYLKQLDPSFFEIATAMAFKYFADSDVDIAVVEVGLGGRLDSTNIIDPILSIITNVSLDHTQLLGSTLEKIATEKAGIMKEGVPCIIGEAMPETRAVFDTVAKEKGARLIYAEDPVVVASATPLDDGSGIQYRTIHGIEFKGELRGFCQEKNTNTILYAIHQLMKMGYLCECEKPENLANIQQEMNRAFMNVTKLTGLQGRWQTVRQEPTVVCDTGHNTGAWEYLSRQLSQVKCHELHIIIGILEDKDIYTIMSMLPKQARYYWTKGSTKRAFPEASLRVFGEQFGLQGSCYATVEEAYNAAIEGAQSDDFIFVGGSNYVVADFLKSRI